MMDLKKFLKIVIMLVLLFIIIQFIPYGKTHINPSVVSEPKWDSVTTQETFYRVCGDCHSNKTKWPGYSKIAPASWLIQADVDEGRANLNVSEWGREGKNKGNEAADEVKDGGMPPFYYRPLHPESKMTQAEKDEFIRGLISTFGVNRQK